MKLTSVERILVRRIRIIGDLNARLVLVRIMIDIDIGTFVESMVGRLRSWL